MGHLSTSDALCVAAPPQVTPGADHKQKATPDQVADYTLKALRRRVPPAVPGIMFLSGALRSPDQRARTASPASCLRALRDMTSPGMIGMSTRSVRTHLPTCARCHVQQVASLSSRLPSTSTP